LLVSHPSLIIAKLGFSKKSMIALGTLQGAKPGIASYPEIQAEIIEDMLSAANHAFYGGRRSVRNYVPHYNLESTP